MSKNLIEERMEAAQPGARIFTIETVGDIAPTGAHWPEWEVIATSADAPVIQAKLMDIEDKFAEDFPLNVGDDGHLNALHTFSTREDAIEATRMLLQSKIDSTQILLDAVNVSALAYEAKEEDN